MKRKITISLLPIFIVILVNFFVSLKINVVFLFFSLIYIFGFFIKSKKELKLSIVAFMIIGVLIIFIEGSTIINFLFLTGIFFVIAMSLGYLSKGKKYLIILFPLLFSIFMFFGFNDYSSFIMGRNSVVIENLPNIILYDKQLNKIDLTKKNKVYVLDFWTTSCRTCFNKFSDFEKTFLKYKDNVRLEFYAVNYPIRNETIDDNINFSNKELNYKFNQLFSKTSSIRDSLKIKGVPQLLIIKNGIIYYKGYFVSDSKFYVHHIETEIKRVLAINE